MSHPVAVATAHMEKLEADRRAAMEVSEQKALEAKLIAARQEGFRAAMDIFRCNSHQFMRAATRQVRPPKAAPGHTLILRELSFSGHPMTASQIAKAIDYIPERTETALKRLEISGTVVRNEKGRWAALGVSIPETNGYSVVAEPPN